MKGKIIKYIIPSVTFAAGIVLAATGLSMGAKKDYINKLNLTNIESVVPSDSVAGININVSFADLEITASNDAEDFEIRAENISRNYLKYSTSGNVFNLDYSTNKWYDISAIPFISGQTGKIHITVPAEVSIKDIQIKTGIGKSDISYLSAEKIYIDCGWGDNNLKAINAEQIEINTGAGDTSGEHIISESLSIDSGSGKTTISNLQTENAKIVTGAGDTKLSGIINGDSSIKCGMGDIDAELYGRLEDYSIYIPKGKAYINNTEFGGLTKGKYKMDITTGVGDVRINFR